MKQCTKCREWKDLSEFHLLYPAKKDGKLRPDCKICRRKVLSAYHRTAPRKAGHLKWHHEQIAKLRKITDAYLETHPCVDCGETDPILLDFDHVSGVKVSSISRLVGMRAKAEVLIAEIEKCVSRCVRCHRYKTAREQKWTLWLRSHPEDAASEPALVHCFTLYIIS